jgi:hypothetical protein
VHADTLLLERHSFGESFSGADFRFSEAMGSSWLVLNWDETILGDIPMDGPGHGGGIHNIHRHTTVRVQVPGLSYDTAAAQIVYTGSTGKIVCATVTEKHGLFGWKSMINLTGACRVFTSVENRAYSVYFEAK